MSTLLYHSGALGDFITTIPALRLWKKSHVADRLILLGHSAIGGLALDAGFIDEAWDIDSARFVSLFRENYSPQAAELLSGFAAAIAFADDYSPLIANLRRSGIAPLHSQPPFHSESGMHIIDYHLSLFADPAKITPHEKNPRIAPSVNVLAHSQSFVPLGIAPVALHPGSGSLIKNWPIEKYRKVADRLRSRGLPIAWIRGPADLPYDVPQGDLLISGAALPLLAAILSRCRLFIGNDSGVAHLATAVGCPALAIFGPSDPAIWSPIGEHVEIIYRNGFCLPCHLRKDIVHSCDRGCLEGISVDEVVSAGEKLIERI